MKQILLFLFIPIILFSQQNLSFDMKAKAKSDGKVVSAKLRLQSPMINFEVAKKYNREVNFISHLTAIVENDIVLDIDMSKSQFIHPKPVIKYKFKDVHQADEIRYILTNNNGEVKEHLFKIKRDVKSQENKKTFKGSLTSDSNFKKTELLYLEANNSQEAIMELYGLIEKPIMNKINLIMPKRIDCAWSIPMTISTDVDLESLALFIDVETYANTIQGSPLAIFSISPISIIDYTFNITMWGKKYTLTVIGKGRDGRFYKVINRGSLPKTSDACL